MVILAARVARHSRLSREGLFARTGIVDEPHSHDAASPLEYAPRVDTLLETILEVDPQHARASHLLGRLYAGVRRTNRITRWIATHLLGGGALKKATWQAAEEYLSFAEQQAPEVSDHHFQLAILYADTDRLELAVEELEHVFPRPVVSHMERMVWEEALEAYTRATELDPENADAWYKRGLALGNLERDEEALQASTRATELDLRRIFGKKNERF